MVETAVTDKKSKTFELFTPEQKNKNTNIQVDDQQAGQSQKASRKKEGSKANKENEKDTCDSLLQDKKVFSIPTVQQAIVD